METKASMIRSKILIDDEEETPTSSFIEPDVKMMPTNFMTYLPWACQQLSIDCVLNITKHVDVKNSISNLSRIKHKSAKKIDSAKKEDFSYKQPKTSDSINLHESFSPVEPNNLVNITTTYSGDDLIHIKIDKTKHIPRKLLSVISLIAPFHPQLNGISINSGTDKYTIHEVRKILLACNITEINMDNTWVEESYYDTILDHAEQLRVLSLARCKLDDDGIGRICSKLEYALPPKGLSVLNLSTNRLTDIGAQHIANMLRTNRQLKYLNLAGNRLTEDGADKIFNVLYKFPFTSEEALYIKNHYIRFVKTKQEAIDLYRIKLLEPEINKNKNVKKMAPKQTPKISSSGDLSAKHSDTMFKDKIYEKAVEIGESEYGPYDYPLGKDTFCADGVFYSNGNLSLSYLNIAFNNLSHNTLIKILDVLKYQNSLPGSPRGLLNICLEGNPLPKVSPLLREIENILDGILSAKTKGYKTRMANRQVRRL
ncbi:hypothetical protein O0L34_g7480 [Tuta absoluta]|nr:hypothetical protein O0L34_g7480 [Tuta absoluta]